MTNVQQTYEAAYTQYYTPIYRNISRYLRGSHEQAEDLTQEVFLRAWCHWSEDTLNIRWYYHVAKNCLIDLHRRAAYIDMCNLSIEMEVAIEDSHDDLQELELTLHLDGSMQDLSQDQREAIRMYIRGHSLVEIAERFQKSVPAVKMFLDRAKKIVRARWLESEAA